MTAKTQANRSSDVFQVLSVVLGFFTNTDTKGFNLVHAVLYCYRFLRSVRGGPQAKEGDNHSQHDPREKRTIRGTGGYGRSVDVNTICDLVQSAFLIFWRSLRGIKGAKPENLTTGTACGRACSAWYKRERKQERIKRDERGIKSLIRRIEASAVLIRDEIPLVSNKQVKQVIDGILAGHKLGEIATDMGVSKQYVSKLLKVLKTSRSASRMRQDERSDNKTPIIPDRRINPSSGKWSIPTAIASVQYDECVRTDDTAWFSGTIPAGQGTPDPLPWPVMGSPAGRWMLGSGFMVPLTLLPEVPFLLSDTFADGAGI